MKCVRPLVALLTLTVLLSQLPFVVTARRVKVSPLQLALSGVMRPAGSSSSKSIQATINATSRVLLTPREYYANAASSKRTVFAAYQKTERALGRIASGSALQQLAAAPMPNVPVLGAYAITAGSLAAPFVAGAEYVVLGGCGALMLGCAGQAQPELFLVAALAALGLFVHSSSKPPSAKRTRKIKTKREHCERHNE